MATSRTYIFKLSTVLNTTLTVAYFSSVRYMEYVTSNFFTFLPCYQKNSSRFESANLVKVKIQYKLYSKFIQATVINRLKNTNNLKKSDKWKMQLSISINFMSSKENYQEHAMHSKRDNIEIMIDDKSGEMLEELFQLFYSR